MQHININANDLPLVDISPAFRGHFTAIDLLRSEGQIGVQIQFRQEPQGDIFTVIDKDIHQNFHFIAKIIGSELILQRNNQVAALDISKVVQNSLTILFVINWSPHHLRLLCGNPGGTAYDTEEVSTPVIIPPPSLVEWARKQNLLEIKEYPSEEKFRERVYSSLVILKDKLAEAKAINGFWNITYDGSNISSRLPKREPDIHPTIHALLYDQMMMGGIKIFSERQTGVGNLDFSFVGTVQGRGICEVFAEFKLAHSKDIDHGLEQQLPNYMNNKGIRYGAYCVLWFKCEWFDEPKNLSLVDLENDLISRLPRINMPGIRIFIYDLGKIDVASKSK
ncbi:hypothetical protein [Dolichospermum circinale]|uniref:hypothetical protein n=1 Tax=Dolichospermum circinale TaxID=109265 RepID=UPI002331349F|nr:hypothetical protein [Dolichospermum circinale]MDB9468144.1 hypothetical protein [Dolichospermum circinale CS-539/09]MDB9470220.1 hypothetical protein [Dolichospermum circinale CS-539]